MGDTFKLAGVEISEKYDELKQLCSETANYVSRKDRDRYTELLTKLFLRLEGKDVPKPPRR